MEFDLNEFSALDSHKKELVLIDFQVMLFLGMAEDEDDNYYEVVSSTGGIARYSVLLPCTFLKQWIPENEYDYLVSVWNLNQSLHKAQ